MAISNNSTGIRTGVCTSTTRPTTPYEGQTIYETNTDLTYIYNGSAWQQVSGGTAVGNSGLVYVTSVTVSSSTASVSVDNCFTSAYTNYRIVINNINLLPNPCDLVLRARISGADYGGAVQYWAYQGLNQSNGAFNSNAAANTFVYLGINSTYNDRMGSVSMDVYAPQLASTRTTATVQAVGYNGQFYIRNGMFIVDNSSQFDGFTILTTSGATPITELTCTVYGYRK